MTNRTCKRCQVDISSRGATAQFCSQLCGNKWRHANETRECSRENCCNKVRMSGLCTTHYNERYDNRHRLRAVACVVCGTVVQRRVDNARLDSHCCSVACRTFRQWGTTQAAGIAPYTWNADAKKRARKAGAPIIEDVDRDAVMERDHWSCYLCGIHLDPDASAFDPSSPTVDHVVPLAAGGTHSMANVRACCLGCNTSKAGRDHPGARPALALAAP